MDLLSIKYNISMEHGLFDGEEGDTGDIKVNI